MEKIDGKTVETVTSNGIKFVDHFKNNWQWWIFATFYILTVIVLFEFVATDRIFKRYDEYISHKHSVSTEYRIETSPIIRNYLNQLVLETGAARAYIGEFHNGKNNPSGLQWQYADMTFINDAAYDVTDEFQNVPLVKYELCYKLYKEGVFAGDIESVEKIDHRMAARLEANDVKFMGAAMMYGENKSDIGFVGVSYTDTVHLSRLELMHILTKYAAKISPYLDDAQAQKQNKTKTER